MLIEKAKVERSSRIGTIALSCMVALSLTGCFEDKQATGSPHTISGALTATAPIRAPTNGAPTISGAPSTSAKVNEAYGFQPAASDPDGDALTFQVSNKPGWAAFDTSTGRLSGTPSSSSTGTFADIRISVSDGKTSSALAPFSISVAGTQTGSAKLSWQPPTENTDGSPLTNLAGYVVRYGTAPDNLSVVLRLANPGLTSYVVSELVPATWYFHVAAYNAAGVESAPSATASKTIS